MEEDELEHSVLRSHSFGFSYGSFGTLSRPDSTRASSGASESNKKGGLFGWLRRSDKNKSNSGDYERVNTEEN